MFVYSKKRKLMRLSQTQLDDFRNNGYLLFKGFASSSLCEEILAKAKVHIEARVEPLETQTAYHQSNKDTRTQDGNYGSKSKEQEGIRRLRQVYEREEVFRAWMKDTKIRPILQELLEDKVVITTAHHNSIMTKMPQSSTATQWHQDRRYWRYSDDNLISIWLALGEENSQNGVLEFVKGSHKIPLSPEQFDEKEYLDENLAENKKLLKAKVSFELEKGDVVLFHSLLLHRANKNTTNRRKISFVYTVKGKKTKAEEGSRSAKYPEIALDFISN